MESYIDSWRSPDYKGNLFFLYGKWITRVKKKNHVACDWKPRLRRKHMI
uniref:Uncharacterized protein n=1 Tax=Rhizophora mucronata TaxID=61149 RepID=A0A2P2IT10_RHIMU